MVVLDTDGDGFELHEEDSLAEQQAQIPADISKALWRSELVSAARHTS